MKMEVVNCNPRVTTYNHITTSLLRSAKALFFNICCYSRKSMTDDGVITNRMLLEHIQAGKHELKQEFGRRFDHLEKRVDTLEMEMRNGFNSVRRELDEARRHREMLQEDLHATIKMQFQHQKQLAVLTGGPLPEEY